MMRTTVTIDDDVLAAARTLAAERDLSLGAAISQLARSGLSRRSVRDRSGIPTFEVAEGAPPITPDMVREAAEES